MEMFNRVLQKGVGNFTRFLHIKLKLILENCQSQGDTSYRKTTAISRLHCVYSLFYLIVVIDLSSLTYFSASVASLLHVHFCIFFVSDSLGSSFRKKSLTSFDDFCQKKTQVKYLSIFRGAIHMYSQNLRKCCG